MRKHLIFILLILIPIGSFAQNTWSARQDFLSGLRAGDERSGSSGIATIDSMVFTGVNTGIWSGAVKYNFLEGSLASPSTITGTEVNYFSIKMSDAGDRSAWFIFRAADGLSMRGYTGDDYTGDSNFFAVDSNKIIMAQYDGAAIKSITIDTVNARGIEVRDDDAGVGLKSFADYSPVATDLSYTQKIYQDRNLGGQTVNATIYSPGDDEHGDIITWDTLTDTYVSTNVIPVAQASGIVICAMDTILYSNITVDTIVTLPVGAVIWDIQVCVITTFNGSGTDLLDVGIITDANRYEDDLDIAVTPVKFLGLANLADRIVGTSYVIFQYFDQNSDASTGFAIIYVRYSIHSES